MRALPPPRRPWIRMSFFKRLLAWFQPDTSRPLTQVWLASVWMGVLANLPLWNQLHAMPGIGWGFIVAFAGMVIAALVPTRPRLLSAVLSLVSTVTSPVL